jgi:hypothetical protein
MRWCTAYVGIGPKADLVGYFSPISQNEHRLIWLLLEQTCEGHCAQDLWSSSFACLPCDLAR